MSTTKQEKQFEQTLETTEYFKVINIKDHDHWIHERSKGIGGSDAGIIVGQSKYKSEYELWQEKTGLVRVPFIKNEAIELGNRMEPILIDMLTATYPTWNFIDTKDISLVSLQHPFMRANLDGLAINENNEYIILECKTTTIQRMEMLDDWKDQIPQTYYCQLLHYFLTTHYTKALLIAYIRIPYFNKAEIRTYTFDSNDEQIKADMEFLLQMEQSFWNKVITKKPPAFISKQINI